MKAIHLAILSFGLPLAGFGQKLDSIYFNLYTDSLKKGTYNYINVEGVYDNGRYLPLGQKELTFTSSAGRFSGNSLYIGKSDTLVKVTVKAVVTKNPLLWKEKVIYIKQSEDAEKLPTLDEIRQRPGKTKARAVPDRSGEQDSSGKNKKRR